MSWRRVVTTWHHIRRFLERFINSRYFVLFCLCVLLGTTAYWSLLGGYLHATTNADEQIYPALFENADTFRQATLSEPHSFILKWPIFWLERIFGSGQGTLIMGTLLVSLLTIGAFAYLLLHLERRNRYIGMLLLGLSSVLLLIPANPYPGALLPINIAMLANRNLEYAVFIGAIIAALHTTTWRSKRFILATALFGVLFASDHLFLAIGLAGCAVTIGLFMLLFRRKPDNRLILWLGSLVAGVVFSYLIVLAAKLSHITTITSVLSPYAFAKTPKQFAQGFIYGFLNVLTNFGANPVYDATTLKTLPSLLTKRLIESYSISYLVNLVILAFMVRSTLLYGRHLTPKKHAHIDPMRLVVLALLGCSLAALASYIVSNHYYVVDGRYLSILLPTLFCMAAYVSRHTVHTYRLRRALPVVLILGLSILLGIGHASQQFLDNKAALGEISLRNEAVVRVLASHKLHKLSGDYWRVLPIRTQNPTIQVEPLDNCTQPRKVLSSSLWRINHQKDDYGYLLSYDKSPTDFPQCSQEQVVAAFGQPDSSVLIAGTLDQPKEKLLIYLHSEFSDHNQPGTLEPITLQQLPKVHCATDSQRVLQVVAHEDDDLLFMSPDLVHSVQAQDCIQSVYVTSGDAGSARQYWINRENGIMAAYAIMLGNPRITWVQSTVKMPGGTYVMFANPKGNRQLSLVFMRLPDGSIGGGGFQQYNNESLSRLYNGRLVKLHSVDAQSEYTSDTLRSTLTYIMAAYEPTELRILKRESGARHASYDHNDHDFSARFAYDALQSYPRKSQVSTFEYEGYTVNGKPANISNDDYKRKLDAFIAYSEYDPAVCHGDAECHRKGVVYGYYLDRQYKEAINL